MSYRHTQTGSLHHIIYLTAGMLVVAAWFCRQEPPLALILGLTGVALVPLAWAFGTLTVADEGDHLSIRFGPLPLFRKRVAYEKITSVEPGRSTLLDGWGIHYVPGRGWIYNLWGFDCVKLTLGSRTLRIGSDDVENLVEFLHTKIQ
jgi:hypothetical protein